MFFLLPDLPGNIQVLMFTISAKHLRSNTLQKKASKVSGI